MELRAGSELGRRKVREMRALPEAADPLDNGDDVLAIDGVHERVELHDGQAVRVRRVECHGAAGESGLSSGAGVKPLPRKGWVTMAAEEELSCLARTSRCPWKPRSSAAEEL